MHQTCTGTKKNLATTVDPFFCFFGACAGLVHVVGVFVFLVPVQAW